MKGSERPTGPSRPFWRSGSRSWAVFIGRGFATGRTRDRYVEVKGLAEQEVTADLALWPLRYVTTGNDLE